MSTTRIARILGLSSGEDVGMIVPAFWAQAVVLCAQLGKNMRLGLILIPRTNRFKASETPGESAVAKRMKTRFYEKETAKAKLIEDKMR
jgi:hypothetical protein